MKHAISLVAVSLAAVACADKPEHSATPTAPSASVAPVSRPSTASTICLSYAGEEARLEAALAKAPDDARLKSQLTAIEAAIKDACG
jgi:uncharacterized lipoprotein YajG